MTPLAATWDRDADLLTLTSGHGGDHDGAVVFGCAHDAGGDSIRARVGVLGEEHPQGVPGYGWQPRATLSIGHDRSGQVHQIEARGLATMFLKHRARDADLDSVAGLRVVDRRLVDEPGMPVVSDLQVDAQAARVQPTAIIKAGWVRLEVHLLPAVATIEPWKELFSECERCLAESDQGGFFGIRIDVAGRLTAILADLPEDHPLARAR